MADKSLKILCIDDSQMALKITRNLLEKEGHEVETLSRPEQALEKLHEVQPDILVCDVMMPGISGFGVLRKIKANGDFEGLRIIMASAKAYEADRNKAKKLGADGYIVKPFTIDKFKTVMHSLDTMKVSAWGVRGTLPAPQAGYIGFGGNTSCYSLQLSPDRYLVFDAGTGIKTLGSALVKSGKTRITADLFITHPHWDHINAFPFFTPLYIPGNHVRVHGTPQDEIGFEELMVAQMDGTYFPVTVREFGAHINFNEIGEQNVGLEDIKVTTIHLKHPGHCLGYRVDRGDRSFCYITDNEIYPADSEFADEEFVEKLADFCRGANILIHDCTYFDEEYPSKVHWGHSALSEVCRMAHMAQAERLWIHHHDPEQDDEAIARKLDVCKEALKALGSETLPVLPTEGTSQLV
jgi:CheY-like chemotaxis protein